MGRHFEDALPPQIAEPLAAALERAALHATTQDFDYEIPIAGTLRRFNAKLTPMMGGAGGDRGYVAVAGVMRSHEGAVLVDEPAERGTRVTLLFPLTS